jgi:hypothetical protein
MKKAQPVISANRVLAGIDQESREKASMISDYAVWVAG